MSRVNGLSDEPAHRKPNDVCAWQPQMIHNADHVLREIAEVEVAFDVVAVAVPPKIEHHHLICIAESGQLIPPIRTIATNAMQENDSRSRSSDVHHNVRTWPNGQR